MRKTFSLLASLLLCAVATFGQAQKDPASLTVIRAGTLIDGQSDTVQQYL